MIKKIAIVGPESTGKSTLSHQLAEHYSTAWVPEYAREYIEKIERPYRKEDLLIIAETQLKLEDQITDNRNLIFCDTTLLVIKIWSEFKYGSCHPWILQQVKQREYDLHLLTYIDLPWQQDPQREHPHARKQLFDIYQNELEKMEVTFEIISGENEERLSKAISVVDKYI